MQGPVKVLVTLKRPPSIKTGPETIVTTHHAVCPEAKGQPVTVPPRKKSGHAGVVKCTFEAALPKAGELMKAAEAAMAAEAEAHPTTFVGPPAPVNGSEPAVNEAGPRPPVDIGDALPRPPVVDDALPRPPVVEAAPKPPAVEAAPKPPAVDAAPKPPVFEAAPKLPAFEAAPKPPAFEAAPKPPAFEAAPRPPVIEAPVEMPAADADADADAAADAEAPVDFDAVAGGVAPSDGAAKAASLKRASNGKSGDGVVRAAGLLDSLLAAVTKPPPPGPAPMVNAAAAEALVPEVTVAVQATPASGAFAMSAAAKAAAPGAAMATTTAAAASPLEPATSPPLRAAFDVPEKACVVVSEVLSGPLAKYILPAASSLPGGARTICGPGATLSYDAKLGGFDASACGANSLSTTASPFSTLLGGSAATVNVDVIGCNKTRIARPDIAIVKLQPVRVVNSTWTAEAAVRPVGAAAAGASGALHLPAKGVATARYGLRLVRTDAEPELRLRGELKITTGSLVPEVLPVARLAVTTPDGATRHVDAKCPPTVVVMSSTCRFDVPWPAGGSGTVQAQLKTLAARTFDVHSGTPKPFDFAAPEESHVGACLALERTYVGQSAINSTAGPTPERPLVNLVTGVDALLGAVNVDLSRYGLPGSSVGQLLGLQPGSTVPNAGALLSAARDVAAATSTKRVLLQQQQADGGSGEEVSFDGAALDGDPQAAAEALWGPAASSGGAGGAAGAAGDAAGASAVSKALADMLPYLHPLKIVSGSAPPGHGARVPMTVCQSANVTWAEQFGGASMEDCGAMYNALSALTLTPNGTNAQPPLRLNASLPVVVSGCDLRPTVKLLGMRSTAAKAYSWSVTARAHDRAVAIPAAPGAPPGTARFTVEYRRAPAPTGNFTLEPALLLLNPFAKALPVKGVYASVAVRGLPPIVTRLGCMGAPASGAGAAAELLLPAAKSPSNPVPVGCVGSVPLPGPVAGEISIITEAASGNKTSDAAPFDLSTGKVDEVVDSPRSRCVTVAGGFERGSTGGDDVRALAPVRVAGAVPQPGTQICESRSFTFDGLLAATPDEAARSCSYVARFIAGAAGRPELAADAFTLLAVTGCSSAIKAGGGASASGSGSGSGSGAYGRPQGVSTFGGGAMVGQQQRQGQQQQQQPQQQQQKQLAAVVPALGLAPLRPYNLTRRYVWSVERRLTPRGGAGGSGGFFNAGLVTLDAGRAEAFDHTVAFRRGLAPGFVPQQRVAGAVNVTNPSRAQPMSLAAVAVSVRRAGAPDASLPLVCPSTGVPRQQGAAVTLGPGQSVRCTFDAALSDARPGVARVVATLPDGRQVGTAGGQPLSFERAPAVAVGECALLLDDFGLQRAPPGAPRDGATPRTLGERPPSARLGEAPLRACAPREFRTVAQLGPFGRGRCGTFTYGGAATARPLGGGEPASSGNGAVVEVVVTGC